MGKSIDNWEMWVEKALNASQESGLDPGGNRKPREV